MRWESDRPWESTDGWSRKANLRDGMCSAPPKWHASGRTSRRFDPASILASDQVLVAKLSRGHPGEAENARLGTVLVTSRHAAAPWAGTAK